MRADEIDRIVAIDVHMHAPAEDDDAGTGAAEAAKRYFGSSAVPVALEGVAILSATQKETWVTEYVRSQAPIRSSGCAELQKAMLDNYPMPCSM